MGYLIAKEAYKKDPSQLNETEKQTVAALSTKEPVCGYCRGDIAAMADKAGLKSLTVYEERTKKILYWDPGMKSLKEKK
ncbi:cytidine deaminase-like fold-containing protein [Cronobacter dublinensis]